MIVSLCASNQRRMDPGKNFVSMTTDVKRACFYAPATRPVFIQIPSEDWQSGDEEMVGQLNLSLSGTRDAAMNWAKTYSEFLISLGFIVGQASPCNYHHLSRGISVTVHGDDFTSTGNETELRWLDGRMKSRFDVKTEILGPGKRHAKQIQVLNRVLTWNEDGNSYEPDQRHAEIIIQAMGVSKAVSTPGTRED